MIDPIKVYGSIYRGAQPTCDDDWRTLKSLGIGIVLNLQNGSKLFNDGDPDVEFKTAQLFGMIMFSVPMGEIEPPSQAELNQTVNYMNEFPFIYVHCRAGVDRTGMVCANYLIKTCHWSRGAAIAQMKALGMHWWYFWWTCFL